MKIGFFIKFIYVSIIVFKVNASEVTEMTTVTLPSSVAGHTGQDLTTLVEKRIGADMFLDKIGNIPKHESYIKALKSPQLRCASVNDLIFDHKFCELFRTIDRDITGIILKKSAADTNGESVGGDVEVYKNFIREQDARMKQFVEANSLLHAENSNLRAQYEEVRPL